MKKNKSIKLDGVSMDRSFIESHKTEKSFLDAMNDKTHAHLYEGENREAKLKEIYAKVHAKEAPVKTEANPRP